MESEINSKVYSPTLNEKIESAIGEKTREILRELLNQKLSTLVEISIRLSGDSFGKSEIVENGIRELSEMIVKIVREDSSVSNTEGRRMYSGMRREEGSVFFMNLAKNGQRPPKYRFDDLLSAEQEQLRLAKETGDEITLLMSLTTVKLEKAFFVVDNIGKPVLPF